MASRKKLRIFSIFSIIILCISLSIKTFQNDTFYIIKLGEDILKYGVDLVDHHSWVANLSYTYPHWLYDVFLYIIYSNFGFDGIYISNMILFIILILSIYIINLKINKNEMMATIISIISLFCVYEFAVARSQLITGILFLWEVYFIQKIISTGKRRYIIFLALISLLVANLHATIWPFYFILYLPFIAHYLVRKLLDYFNKNDNLYFNKLLIDNFNNFKLLIISLILSLFMGFLTPSKICFTYIFKIMQGSSQSYILEHAPMVLIQNWPFLILILLILIVLIFSNVRIKLSDFFMVGGLVFMSLSSIRHIFLFYIIGLLYVTIFCNSYLLKKKDVTLDILANLFVKNKVIYCSGFVLIIVLSFFKFQYNNSFDYTPKDEYPVDAVNFIKENLNVNEIRLYNQYNFGSYLLFNDIPAFIDSRCDLYLKEFNGLDYSIFDDAMEIEYDYNYEEKFDFYDVTHALIIKKSTLNKLLEKDNNYEKIYSDKYFNLFEVNEVEA